MTSSQFKEMKLLRTAFYLAVLGLLWHFGEAAAGWWLGSALQSPTLKGFALDSGAEIMAGAALLLRLRGFNISERVTGRIIAVSFFLIAAWVSYEAFSSWINPPPEGSSSEQLLAILLGVVVIATMYPLAYFKSRTASELHSDSARAESRQTYLCGHMAWLLLLGVAGPAVGLAFIDGLAALLIAALALREGLSSWRSGPCGCAMHIDGVDYGKLQGLSKQWTLQLKGGRALLYQYRFAASLSMLLVALLGFRLSAGLLCSGLALLGLLMVWVSLFTFRERAERSFGKESAA